MGQIINGLAASADDVAELGLPQGRLTLESGIPISVSDVLAATSLFYTPYNGHRVVIWNPSTMVWEGWELTEIEFDLTGLTADKNYDVFIYNDGGSLDLDLEIWTDDSTRAVSLDVEDARLIKSTDGMLYLGTIRITGTTGQCEDSLARRFVWNNYSRVLRQGKVEDGTDHSYNSTVDRYYNNDSTNIIELINGLVDYFYILSAYGQITTSSSNSTNRGRVGLGLNVVGVTYGIFGGGSVGIQEGGGELDNVSPTLGYNFITLCQDSFGAANATYRFGKGVVYYNG